VLSGMGLAAWLLNREIPAGADPLGPENILGLVSGLLTGTGAQMCGRWMAVGKSPLTGGWGDANGGGHFSPAIKRSGYDGIFFRGKSDKPVYLHIKEGEAKIQDASGLWGLDTVQTEERLLEMTGAKNLKVACIGPAGENISLISGIVTDGARIAARSGLGAVMGSKNLKAVALSGKEKPTTQNPDEIKSLSKKFAGWVVNGDRMSGRIPKWFTRLAARFMRSSPIVFAAGGDMIRVILPKYGTIVTNIISSESGDSPVKNWKGVGMRDFPMSTHSGKLDPETIISCQEKKYHCSSCPIGCGGVLNLEGKTRFDLKETHKPEYETSSAFGSLILNNDLDAIFYINDYLNRAGMDTISAGSTVSFAMECYENGILSKDGLDGLDLKWGNCEAVIELIKKMVARDGVGDLLADGSKAAAKKLGGDCARFAMHAGGQDLPMHDSRLDPGFGVAYSMEPTPGRHTNYCYLYLELFGLDKIFKDLPELDAVYLKSKKMDTRDREVLLSAASKYLQVVNGAGACLFAVQCGPAYPLVSYLNAATGWGLSAEKYLETGARIQHLRQAFNVKHGVVPARDFKLPARVIGDPPLKAGPLKGVTIPLGELNDKFSVAMGWDKDGRPLPAVLREMELDDLAEEIEYISKE
jgi:aldehyde:ferredoxin oxidoreductase